MCADINGNIILHLTERCVTDKVHFFLDIDFEFKESLPDSDELLKEIQEAVRSEFSEQEIECIVSKRTPWKIHINFSSLLLTNSESLTTARNVRNHLKEKCSFITLADDRVQLKISRVV